MRLISRNPATLAVNGSVPATSMAGVARAVSRARAALGAWRERPLGERARIVHRAARLVGRRGPGLSRLITREVGKPIREAESEIRGTVRRIAWVADHAVEALSPVPVTVRGARKTGPPESRAEIFREPAGVAAIITPWNYPLIVPCAALAPALAAGNTVVFKPSELTPLCGQAFADILHEAGIPSGVLECVQGADAVGRALVRAEVDLVSFTGSGGAGRDIARACGERLRKVSLELGGKDPAIVCADAPMPASAARLTAAALYNCGQECCSVERVYVERRLGARFTEAVLERVRALRVGDPMDPATEVGPLIGEFQRRTVEEQVRDAVRRGARALCGARRMPGRGFFYPPTVLDRVNHRMRIMREETFGPVIPIMEVRSPEEAVRLANDSPYGLSASVWSADLVKARRLAARIAAGCVWINDADYVPPELPWGGVKGSGYGRVLSREGILEFTVTRTRVVMP